MDWESELDVLSVTLWLVEGSSDNDFDVLRESEPSGDAVRDGDVVCEEEKLREPSFVIDVDWDSVRVVDELPESEAVCCCVKLLELDELREADFESVKDEESEADARSADTLRDIDEENDAVCEPDCDWESLTLWDCSWLSESALLDWDRVIDRVPNVRVLEAIVNVIEAVAELDELDDFDMDTSSVSEKVLETVRLADDVSEWENDRDGSHESVPIDLESELSNDGELVTEGERERLCDVLVVMDVLRDWTVDSVTDGVDSFEPELESEALWLLDRVGECDTVDSGERDSVSPVFSWLKLALSENVLEAEPDWVPVELAE
jgi:hypothetical protein